MSSRNSIGQATLEYLGVLGVVTAVLTAVASPGVAPAIANGVGRGFQRALCMVTGSGCATVDARPCTVRTSSAGGSVTAKLAFVRIGGEAGLLRAERSDGSVSITLLEHLQAGLTAGVGAGGHLRLGEMEIGEGEVAQVEAVARLGGGRTWRLPDAAAASVLQRRLVEVLAGTVASHLPVVGHALSLVQDVLDVGDGRDLPPASSHIYDAHAGIDASVKIDGDTGLAAGLGVGVGLTTTAATGSRSVLLKVDGDAGVSILEGLGGLSGAGGASIEITFDHAGHALELAVAGTGQGSGKLTGGHLLPAALASHQRKGASVSASLVLDLKEPSAAQAMRRLVAALSPKHLGDLPAAARSLAAVLTAEGRLDVQRYGTRETGLGLGGEVGLGAQVGGDVEVTRASTELLDAWTKPPGGAWERRLDCLA